MENVTTESTVEHPVLAKCAHEGCTCTVVESGERFCSDYCLAQAGTEHASADDECQCGHAECEHVVASPAVPGFGLG